MKRVAEAGEPPVVVPVVVVPVHIDVALAIEAIERSVALYRISPAPLSLECSQDCIESGILLSRMTC